MSQGQTADFAQLYRAALAERDPDKKLMLLREVQQALHSWHQAMDSAHATELGTVPGGRSNPNPSTL